MLSNTKISSWQSGRQLPESHMPGFTLVELLVVISIISLLVSILLPALARAREAGRDVKCLSNLHSIGIAMATHAADYDGRLPYGNGGQSTGEHWMPALAPYLGISNAHPNWDVVSYWADVHPLKPPYGPFPEAIYCPTGFAESKISEDNYGGYASHWGESALKQFGWEKVFASKIPPGIFLIGEGSFSIKSPIDHELLYDLDLNGVPDSDRPPWPTFKYDWYNKAEPKRHPGGKGGGHANYAFVDGSARRADFDQWEHGSGLWSP